MNAVWWRLFLLIVVLAPLPFGSFRPWAWSVVGVAATIAGSGWVLAVASGRLRPFWRWWLAPPVLLFAGVVAWILVQAAAPAGNAGAHPIWQLTEDATGVAVRHRISAAPEQAYVALIRLLAGATVFWLAMQFGRERVRALQLIRWIGTAAALYALYGLVNFIAGNDYLLIFRRWAYIGDVTGPFVNRNTFATYAGLGVLTLSVLFADGYRRRWRETDPTLSWVGRRQATLAGWPAIHLTGAVICAMALLQSHSRMGLVASGTGFAMLLLLMSVTGLVRGWIPIAVATAICGLAFYASGAGVLERIATGGGSDRPELAALTQQAIQSAPLLGSGYGGFASVFPMYRDTTLPAPAVYEMAHSTYLELAMEIGLPATAALLIALFWFGMTALVGAFRRERDRSLPALGFAATVLVAVHATLDFSMQIPGVQLTFAAILGMAVAQSFSTFDGDRPLPAPGGAAEPAGG